MVSNMVKRHIFQYYISRGTDFSVHVANNNFFSSTHLSVATTEQFTMMIWINHKIMFTKVYIKYEKNKQKLKLCTRNKAMNFFLAFLGSDDNRTNKDQTWINYKNHVCKGIIYNNKKTLMFVYVL